MPARGRTVELITTKEIDLFLPIMRELADDFGDRFLLSMLHWCWNWQARESAPGLGSISTPGQS